MPLLSKRFLKAFLLIAVPLVLLDIVVEQWSWRPKVLARLPAPADRLAFSPDGKVLAVAVNRAGARVELRNVPGGSLVGTLTVAGQKLVESISFSPDGGMLAGTVYRHHEPAGVAVWNIDSGTSFVLSMQGEYPPNRVVFTDNGRTITGISCSSLQVWDAQTFKLLRSRRLKIGPHPVMALSPDARFAATARRYPLAALRSRTPSVEIWDLRVHQSVKRLKVMSSPTDVAFGSGGTSVAVSAEIGDVSLWGLDKFGPYRTLGDTDSQPTAVAFSPDGATLAVAGTDRTVNLWRVR